MSTFSGYVQSSLSYYFFLTNESEPLRCGRVTVDLKLTLKIISGSNLCLPVWPHLLPLPTLCLSPGPVFQT